MHNNDGICDCGCKKDPQAEMCLECYNAKLSAWDDYWDDSNVAEYSHNGGGDWGE
jgi:hypothetical protein